MEGEEVKAEFTSTNVKFARTAVAKIPVLFAEGRNLIIGMPRTTVAKHVRKKRDVSLVRGKEGGGGYFCFETDADASPREPALL